MNKKPITVQTIINAPLSKVWECWVEPKHITGWTFASDDWEAPFAENDLKIGGQFKTVMAAKNKSHSFDFTGTYTVVTEQELIEYDMDDGRHVQIISKQSSDGTEVVESFDPEGEHSLELQRNGWQAILDNFKKYAESNS